MKLVFFLFKKIFKFIGFSSYYLNQRDLDDIEQKYLSTFSKEKKIILVHNQYSHYWLFSFSSTKNLQKQYCGDASRIVL